MIWLDMLTMTIAALGALECVTGRLAAMHWRQHRGTLMVGYLVASGVCILAASLIWQGSDARWLDAAAWVVCAHLALTWGDWRDGPPLHAYRAPPVRYRAGDLVPSSQFDDGRR